MTRTYLPDLPFQSHNINESKLSGLNVTVSLKSSQVLRPSGSLLEQLKSYRNYRSNLTTSNTPLKSART